MHVPGDDAVPARLVTSTQPGARCPGEVFVNRNEIRASGVVLELFARALDGLRRRLAPHEMKARRFVMASAPLIQIIKRPSLFGHFDGTIVAVLDVVLEQRSYDQAFTGSQIGPPVRVAAEHAVSYSCRQVETRYAGPRPETHRGARH